MYEGPRPSKSRLYRQLLLSSLEFFSGMLGPEGGLAPELWDEALLVVGLIERIELVLRLYGTIRYETRLYHSMCVKLRP